MKILVTGGAGFIGTNFLYYMVKNHPDYELICVDKLTYAGNIANLLPLRDKNDPRYCPFFRFYRADICDEKIIGKIFEQEKPDIVINFAAESHVDRSIESPRVFLDTNIMGTACLLDQCRKFGVKRFHQVSTDEVYGDLPLDRPDMLFSEHSPIRPSSPYSVSKASADMLTLAYGRTYGLPVSVSRCSNNYGPYQFPEKLIPLMISKAVDSLSMPVYGNGLNVRDWLYVEDHCRAIDMIVHKGADGSVYNIGGNCEMRNIDIVKLICDKCGQSRKLITFVADRKGHDLRYAIDASKLLNDLGWEPQMTFENGMEQTINWYLSNSAWWKEILSGEYKNYGEELL